MSNRISLENQFLKLSFDVAECQADVLDKSSGVSWRMRGATDEDLQLTIDGTSTWYSLAAFKNKKVWQSQDQQSLLVQIPEAFLHLSVTLNQNEVVFEVTPFNEGKKNCARDILWPRHFLMERQASSYAVWPLMQGQLVPGDFKGRFHHPEGYAEQSMAWHGGYQGQAGFCAIAHTPDDMYLAMWDDDDTAASSFLHWLPSHSQLRYTRKVVYTFQKGLDYLQMAALYRKHMKEVGKLVTLKEKAEKNSNLKQLFGGCVLDVAASKRDFRRWSYDIKPFSKIGEHLQLFKDSTQINKASVHLDGWGTYGYDNMHPDVLPANADCGGTKGLQQLSKLVKEGLGYLFGLHDQYIDHYTHAPSYDEKWLKVKENGLFDKVNNWAGGLCVHNCYTSSYHFAKRNIFDGVTELYFRHNSKPVAELFAPTSYYLDCFSRTVECFSEEHPLTRTQNREMQNKILEMVRTGNHGQYEPIVLQCEHARDFIVPNIDFSYGLGSFQADLEYVGSGFSSAVVGVTVPLWHLVFHDCVILPHYTKDNHMNYLYGQIPWFPIGRYQNDFKGVPENNLKIKKHIMALHEDVCLSTMSDHALLESDGSVQKTSFEGVDVTLDSNQKKVLIEGGRADTKGEWVSYVLDAE